MRGKNRYIKTVKHVGYFKSLFKTYMYIHDIIILLFALLCQQTRFKRFSSSVYLIVFYYTNDMAVNMILK